MEENKLIQEIKELKTVKSFLTEHGFEDTIVDENPLVFCSYKIKLDKCKGCKQLADCKQSIPGNVLPSRNSNDAPPPVEICVILSANPCFSIAAAESPPPIIVIASKFAKILATSFVPASKLIKFKYS